MMIILPQFTIELEEELDKVIKDLAAKNNIDLSMVADSRAIENAKQAISSVLVKLYENYGVEDRKRLEDHSKND